MDQRRRQSCCCCCPYRQDRRSYHRSQTFECDASRDQCPICKERHCNKKGNIIPHLGACPEFKEMSTDRQKEKAISLNHCLVCLKSKDYKYHKTPCNHSKLYCTFCPDPACKSHRSKYCRNKPDHFSPRPPGDPDGKCSEDDQKSNNSEGEKDTQLDSYTATPQI